MAITFHCATEENGKFVLNDRILCVKPIYNSVSHTAEFVKQVFVDELESHGFNIKDNRFLTAIVSDNGPNMKGKAGISTVFRRVPCADHGIATAITTVFNKVSKSITEGGVKKKVHQYRYADDSRMCSVYELIDACKALVEYVHY